MRVRSAAETHRLTNVACWLLACACHFCHRSDLCDWMTVPTPALLLQGKSPGTFIEQSTTAQAIASCVEPSVALQQAWAEKGCQQTAGHHEKKELLQTSSLYVSHFAFWHRLYTYVSSAISSRSASLSVSLSAVSICCCSLAEVRRKANPPIFSGAHRSVSATSLLFKEGLRHRRSQDANTPSGATNRDVPPNSRCHSASHRWSRMRTRMRRRRVKRSEVERQARE